MDRTSRSARGCRPHPCGVLPPESARSSPSLLQGTVCWASSHTWFALVVSAIEPQHGRHEGSTNRWYEQSEDDRDHVQGSDHHEIGYDERRESLDGWAPVFRSTPLTAQRPGSASGFRRECLRGLPLMPCLCTRFRAATCSARGIRDVEADNVRALSIWSSTQMYVWKAAGVPS
jgi:hypothetical protein